MGSLPGSWVSDLAPAPKQGGCGCQAADGPICTGPGVHTLDSTAPLWAGSVVSCWPGNSWTAGNKIDAPCSFTVLP